MDVPSRFLRHNDRRKQEIQYDRSQRNPTTFLCDDQSTNQTIYQYLALAMASFTKTQEQVLAITPKVTGSIGLVSALFLISEIVEDHRQGKGNVILRALGGISVFEAFDAFAWFLSSWAAPKGSFAFAAGNVSSCEFQGFWLQFVIGAPLCSCAMAYYFYLIVLKGKTADALATTEMFAHGSIFAYASITSFLLLFLNQYNHIGTVCWVQGAPSGCGNSVYDPTDIPCDRGEWAWLYGGILFYIPLWICILVIGFCNFRIYFHLCDPTDAAWFASQSLLYALAFCVTWTPSTIWSVAHWSGAGGFYLDLASAICEPLAGFWNLLIFLRSRPKSRQKLFYIVSCGRYQNATESENKVAENREKAPPESADI